MTHDVPAVDGEYTEPQRFVDEIRELFNFYAIDSAVITALSLGMAALFLGVVLHIKTPKNDPEARKKILKELKEKVYQIVEQRMQQYSADRPLGNLLAAGELLRGYAMETSEEFQRKLPVLACLVRLTDKYARLRHILMQEKPNEEALIDTCIDGCAYALFVPILEVICNEKAI